MSRSSADEFFEEGYAKGLQDAATELAALRERVKELEAAYSDMNTAFIEACDAISSATARAETAERERDAAREFADKVSKMRTYNVEHVRLIEREGLRE